MGVFSIQPLPGCEGPMGIVHARIDSAQGPDAYER
jgi:hypothetical protein